MNRFRIARVVPVVLGNSGIVTGGSLARGASPAQAAGAGLFVALAATGLLAALLLIRQAGRAAGWSVSTRPKSEGRPGPRSGPYDQERERAMLL